MFDIEIRNLNPVEGGFFDTKTEQTPVGKRGSAEFNFSSKLFRQSRRYVAKSTGHTPRVVRCAQIRCSFSQPSDVSGRS